MMNDANLQPAARAASERLVLLMAENDSDTNDLVRQLAYFGYQVSGVSDLAMLYTILRDEAPLAIITDGHFAVGDYPEAITVVQRQLGLQVPLIFITEHNDMRTRLQAVRTGGIALLTRPFDVSEIVGQLNRLATQTSEERYRVLVVAATTNQAHELAAILNAADVQTHIVIDPLFIERPLTEFQPDVLLMDLDMPHCSGPELAAVVRQQDAFASIPAIFLVPDTERDQRFSTLDSGADDVLRQPVDQTRLVALVNSRAHRARVLRALMVRDSMTGLLNHSALRSHLDVELARARRSGLVLTMALIDIDDFKLLNERYGYSAGDRVIKSLAQLLRRRLRASDSIGRHSGQQFALLLPEASLENSVRIVDELRQHFAAMVYKTGNQSYQVSFSAGVAGYPAWSNARGLLAAAETALSYAKRAAKNRVVQDGT